MMPLISILLLMIFMIADVPAYFVIVWLLAMWLGTLIRPPLDVILNLIRMNSTVKGKLKQNILNLRTEIETFLHN
jgi:hypothetical protein